MKIRVAIGGKIPQLIKLDYPLFSLYYTSSLNRVNNINSI